MNDNKPSGQNGVLIGVVVVVALIAFLVFMWQKSEHDRQQRIDDMTESIYNDMTR